MIFLQIHFDQLRDIADYEMIKNVRFCLQNCFIIESLFAKQFPKLRCIKILLEIPSF